MIPAQVDGKKYSTIYDALKDGHTSIDVHLSTIETYVLTGTYLILRLFNSVTIEAPLGVTGFKSLIVLSIGTSQSMFNALTISSKFISFTDTRIPNDIILSTFSDVGDKLNYTFNKSDDAVLLDYSNDITIHGSRQISIGTTTVMEKPTEPAMEKPTEPAMEKPTLIDGVHFATIADALEAGISTMIVYIPTTETQPLQGHGRNVRIQVNAGITIHAPGGFHDFNSLILNSTVDTTLVTSCIHTKNLDIQGIHVDIKRATRHIIECPGFRMIHEIKNLNPTFWKKNVHGLSCMHDTEPFNGPIFSYPVRRENDIWYVQGVFCSLECTLRFIIDNEFLHSTVSALFRTMCLQVYNVDGNVIPAPSQQMLTKFFPWPGGLTITEFRAKGKSNIAISLTVPPVFPFVCEELAVCIQDNNKEPPNNTAFTVIKDLVANIHEPKEEEEEDVLDDIIKPAKKQQKRLIRKRGITIPRNQNSKRAKLSVGSNKLAKFFPPHELTSLI